MRITPIAFAVAGAYGMQRNVVESAAWLWFEWGRDRAGQLTYRWRQ